MKYLILISLIVLSYSNASYAIEASNDVANLLIGGSSHCQPANHSYREKLILTVRGWKFDYNQGGYAQLICTVPVVARGNTTYTYLRNRRTFIDLFTHMYDPDRDGRDSYINVYLIENPTHSTNGATRTRWHHTVYSNNSAAYSKPYDPYDYLDNRSLIYDANTSIYRSKPNLYMNQRSMYSFLVSMYRRKNTSGVYVASPLFKKISINWDDY